MKRWFKYLFVFYILLCSTGFAMAQGPYSFSNSWSNPISYTSTGSPGGTSVYQSITLTQGDELKHLDYSVSWKDQGTAVPPWTNSGGAWANLKIELYDDNNIFVQTLETIYDYTVVNYGYYTYTGSLNFNIPIQAGYKVQIEITATSQNWSSYVNAATITAVTGSLCEALIFDDDFQTSPIRPEWSTTSGVLPVLFSYNSTQVFGPFGDQGTINLDLSALPTHSYIRVEFDLYIFDSWDGNGDDWKLKVDGVDRIHTDFDNHTWWSAPGNMQSYPHNVEFLNPLLTGAFQTGLPSRCWAGQSNTTSMYKINNITQHTSTFLTIGLQGLGLQSLCDESWGIDNVKVYALGILDGCTDPTACNYDPLATCDDGSCAGLWGCMDNTACNYNALATCDDGSCILPDGCTDPAACNYNAIYLCDDGNCVYDVGIPIVTNSCPGMNDGQFTVIADSTHLNYDPSAIYHWGIGSSGLILFNTPISSLSPGFFQYFTIVAGILCTGNTFTINEYAAMTLATTGVANCDSSYAVVSASGAPYSGGTVSTLTYCSSSPGTFAYSNIELVRLVGDGDSIVNNTSGICDDYTDYTTQYTTLTPGQSYSVDVNLGSCIFHFTDSVKVFIDWNIDGDFTDSGEMVGVFGGLSPTSNTFPFTVPNNGSYGATRMRVVSQLQSTNTLFPSGPVGPCDVGDYGANGTYDQPWFGATEDYSIVISATGTLTNATYQWYSGAGSTTPIVGETDSITNSLAAGQYTVIVTDANGCEATETVSVGPSYPVHIDSLIANPDVACPGEIITLTAYPSSPSYEYNFKWRDSGTTSWNNISGFSGWLANNTNPQYGPIYQDTDFRVRIRSSMDNSCITGWETITVPVNILPSSGPIWHN